MGEEERPASPLAIALFGPFDVRLEGRPLTRLRSQKSYWLLALLALQKGRAVERAWLAGMLWPDSTGRQAAFNLTRNLTDLRRSFGPEARRLDPPTTQTLRLDLVGAEADLLIFDEAIARGDSPSLAMAVGLYRGPLLQGCAEEWVFQEREAREQAYLAALETLASQAMAQEKPAEAVHSLRRLVVADPLRDSAQRGLMQALAAAGDVAAATQVYRDFRVRLHQELNAAPDAETTALYQQIRAEARRRRVAVPASLRETGEARIVPAAPPRVETLPSRLPRPLTRLVGREKELQEVRARLARVPLVTLTGPGGIGKTRLAIQVAEECRNELGEGMQFVDLAGLRDASLVPLVVATALGVREAEHPHSGSWSPAMGPRTTAVAHGTGSRAPTVALQEFLAPRQFLLILDNCEHLVAACATLSEALLSVAPRLRILATSRQPLGLTGETTWPVPPLSLPEADTVEMGRLNPRTPEHLLQSEAVRLFLERATAITPAFALTERNATAVAQLCRRLDGIPLAIELAAARLRALTVDQIAARLDDRFRLLTVGGRTAPPRQQTLRAMMDWSHDLLSEPERILLRRLAVFAGGFTLEAVEAVCADPVGSSQSPVGSEDEGLPSLPTAYCLLPTDELLDLLALLVEKSLVTFEASEGADPRGAFTRYRLLETVREYARERLEEIGEAGRVRERHLAFYLRLAENAVPYLAGPDLAAWLERLDQERDNLGAALDRSLEQAPEQALRLVGALAGFWEERCHLEEGRRRLAAALERAGPARRSSAGAAALAGASALALLQGDRPSARALLEESMAIRRKLGDQAAIADSLAHLARLASHRDDCRTARVLYKESLAIQREQGDHAGIATVLAGLGEVARHQQAYAQARSLLEQSLAIRRALGDRNGIAHSLAGLGDVILRQGDCAAARACYEQALAMWRQLGDRAGVAHALGELANVFQQQRDYTEARRLREESLALLRTIGFRGAVFHALGALGHLAREQGKYQEAWAFHAESLRLRTELGDTYAIAQSLEDIAELAASEQQWNRVSCIMGAVTTLRAAIGTPLPPAFRAERDRHLATARAAIGQQAFEMASAAGRAMTLEEAIRYALAPCLASSDKPVR